MTADDRSRLRPDHPPALATPGQTPRGSTGEENVTGVGALHPGQGRPAGSGRTVRRDRPPVWIKSEPDVADELRALFLIGELKVVEGLA